jgi:hypothetical protein
MKSLTAGGVLLLALLMLELKDRLVAATEL